VRTWIRGGRRVGFGAVAVALAVTLGLAGSPAMAVPPPPPNPSDGQISAAQAQANQKAGQVGALNNQLAQSQSQLQDLSDQVELKEEDANKALVDLQSAQDAASRAQAAANAAQVAANAAAAGVEQVRQQSDQFVEGSYEQGSMLGSVSAYLGSKSPADMLERQQLLSAMSTSELDVMDQMQRARTEQANADSTARAALDTAQQKQVAATTAKHTADTATADAEAAQKSQATQISQLQTTQTGLEQQLSAAQANVGDLQSERQQYQNWQAQQQAEQAQQAQAAARQSGGGVRVSAPSGSAVAIVIGRAMAELGVPYAWGGGTESGPSRGIHDWGVADSFGDYNKIGFDCSGLMVYAFAGVGIDLPHYSGYQYTAGEHVPLSQIQPGDMIFYGGQDGIHHVTLYIGNGEMIEAPESGEVVHVTPVRYDDGIMPYATRLL
jgi:cell wall-associated NlpC family hydrolase